MPQLFSVSEGSLVKLDPDSSTETQGLQHWIADHPELLAGEEMDPNDPRRFLLVKREVHDSSGLLDHLFVDQSAVPTFVEAKLSANPEARRKVVGQLLDYVSEACASWDASQIAAWFAERCAQEGVDARNALGDFEPEIEDPLRFWHRAEEHLRAGNVRLVFACDNVPPSLQRIVEFMNERMNPTEVLALEVRCLKAGTQTIYSSSLVGATEQAQAVKGKARKPPVLAALIGDEHLSDGQRLWLLKDTIPAPLRPSDDDDQRLRLTLRVDENKQPRMLYDVDGGEPQRLWPSQAYGAIRKTIEPDYSGAHRLSAVHDRFSTEPGGKSLGKLAVEVGAWESA